MVSIDGVDITDATIDGTPVTEITVDGTTVWTAETIEVLEDWESGTTANWATSNVTVDTTRPYEGSYSMYGVAGGGNQRVIDDETDGNLPNYQRIGDRCRMFFYHPIASGSMNGTTRARWGYGGPWGSNYVVQWSLSSQSIRLWKDGTGTSIAGPVTIVYPGGEWWAIEAEWGTDASDTTNTTHTIRVMNYSDPNNPVEEASLTANDDTISDASVGHYWGVWNGDTQGNFFADHAHFY